MYLLDTNTCIALLRDRTPASARIVHRLVAHDVGEIAVSALTVAELEYGVARSREPVANRRRLAQFLLPLQILPFDSLAAFHYGIVRAELELQGAGIGPIDTLLAAHALSVRAVMVTGNVREFRRVAELEVEDWGARARE